MNLESIRVLWVSSQLFSDKDEKQSGVWQKALADKLLESNLLVLGNVSFQTSSKSITKSFYKNIVQWGLPRKGKIKKGLPHPIIRHYYNEIIEDFNPDLIQVWGSENPLKLLPFVSQSQIPVLLTIQGVLGTIGATILRGLSLRDVLYTIGLREILFNSSLLAIKRSFEKEAIIESQVVNCARFIETQSEWTKAQIISVNPSAKYLITKRVLRPAFMSAEKWTHFDHINPIIYTASWGYSLKGLHVLIRALAIVKRYYSNVQLRIAGAVGRNDWLGDGYLRLIIKMIKINSLGNNVFWLGSIDASEIISELQQASVFVNASFVESYSVALAEAMCVGTPSVVSYAGAMPELAEPDSEALYFTPGDHNQCAFQILKLLNNPDLAYSLSLKALDRNVKKVSETDIVQIQYRNYLEVLSSFTPN